MEHKNLFRFNSMNLSYLGIRSVPNLIYLNVYFTIFFGNLAPLSSWHIYVFAFEKSIYRKTHYMKYVVIA